MIISCLLTRKCNLKCDYCRIVRDYKDKPDSYPSIKDYLEKEKQVSYKLWCKLGLFFKQRNPNVFMLLYGGEPTLYPDLEKIVDYYNENNIMYSIITNAKDTSKIEPLLPKLFGLTCSVDPGNLSDKDRSLKSEKGWNFLKNAKKQYPKLDVVAEVVLDKENYENLEDLILEAKDNGIRLSVTIIEKPENKYYDFAELSSEKLLLNRKSCNKLLEVISKYENTGILINPYAIKTVLTYGSQNLDCDISQENFYVIDSDFRPRLCLRIRGVETPSINLKEYVEDLNYLDFYKEFTEKASVDKTLYCEGCSWTCAVMKDANVLGD